MKNIIRLTESDLHSIIEGSVKKILREEQDKNLLLQTIAQAIIKQGSMEVNLGEMDANIDMGNGYYAYITFEVYGEPFIRTGERSLDRDVPPRDNEIIDEPTVEVGSIDYCNADDECIQILDNGIVKQALEKVIDVNYGFMDIPYEKDMIDRSDEFREW